MYIHANIGTHKIEKTEVLKQSILDERLSGAPGGWVMATLFLSKARRPTMPSRTVKEDKLRDRGGQGLRSGDHDNGQPWTCSHPHCTALSLLDGGVGGSLLEV